MGNTFIEGEYSDEGLTGSDPAADEGHPVYVGDVIILDSAAQIAGFKAIRTGTTSGVLKVTYFH